MEFQIRQAARKAKRLKLGLIGPTGTGKTRTALQVAAELAKLEGTRVGFIDTEHGSAELYAGDRDHFGNVLNFDVIQLSDHRPEVFTAALRHLEREGYGVVVIDSASHAWHNILEFVDSTSGDRGGKFGSGWKKATPRWRNFLESLVAAQVHLIVCMRAKMQYAQEGKQVVKLGMGAEMRSGAEYEFDVIGEFQEVGVLAITKSRNVAITDKIYRQPGADMARDLMAWLGAGKPPLDQLKAHLGDQWDLWLQWLAEKGKQAPTDATALKQLDYLRAHPGLLEGYEPAEDGGEE